MQKPTVPTPLPWSRRGCRGTAPRPGCPWRPGPWRGPSAVAAPRRARRSWRRGRSPGRGRRSPRWRTGRRRPGRGRRDPTTPGPRSRRGRCPTPGRPGSRHSCRRCSERSPSRPRAGLLDVVAARAGGRAPTRPFHPAWTATPAGVSASRCAAWHISRPSAAPTCRGHAAPRKRPGAAGAAVVRCSAVPRLTDPILHTGRPRCGRPAAGGAPRGDATGRAAVRRPVRGAGHGARRGRGAARRRRDRCGGGRAGRGDRLPARPPP